MAQIERVQSHVEKYGMRMATWNDSVCVKA